MLKSLEIKDYALIEHIQTEFDKGLNIITGETGAGKSILIDAMNLLLGQRASTEVVRKGAQKSFVEGIFDVEGNKKVKAILEENDIEFQPELIIRREISLKGSNRCFINDSPVQLQVIKEVGDLLVDIHGQHEHQSILRVETHINFLDEFANTASLLEEYRTLYRKLNNRVSDLRRLKESEKSLREKKDIYEFQIREIDSINPTPDEDEQIINELNILENSEKLLGLSEEIYNLLYEGENSVNDLLGEIRNKLSQLAQIDKELSESESEFETAVSLLKELASTVRKYRSKIDVDPAEVEAKRERLGSLNMLKKKYGGTLHSVLSHREKIGKEFELAENFSEEIEKAESEIAYLRKSTGDSAKVLSEKRKKASGKVESEVKKSLSHLGIADAVFKVKTENIISDNSSDSVIVDNNKYLADENGIDKVEFFISTNPGEDVKPLIKVASGGEVSRIMLSLKSILAKSDKLPLLIFDEIDTGVSGRIAQKVGTALKELASFHQIIAITHLPQIAAQADHHFTVEKSVHNDRVVSSIKKLSENERVTEVAKLLSGEKVTQESIKGAKQLMNFNS